MKLTRIKAKRANTDHQLHGARNDQKDHMQFSSICHHADARRNSVPRKQTLPFSPKANAVDAAYINQIDDDCPQGVYAVFTCHLDWLLAARKHAQVCSEN